MELRHLIKSPNHIKVWGNYMETSYDDWHKECQAKWKE